LSDSEHQILSIFQPHDTALQKAISSPLYPCFIYTLSCYHNFTHATTILKKGSGDHGRAESYITGRAGIMLYFDS